jgi:hypothetical protein
VRSLLLLANPWSISGLSAKPFPRQARDPELVERADGFAQARLNSELPPKREQLKNGKREKINLSVLRSIHFAPFRDDFGEKQIELGTTDGIHQRVNSWKSAAPNQRGRLR